MVAVYGKLGLITHISLSITSLTITYSMVKYGNLDYNKALSFLGVENAKIDGESTAKGASDFAIAYVIHKATMPIRVPITLAIVPIVARILRRR